MFMCRLHAATKQKLEQTWSQLHHKNWEKGKVVFFCCWNCCFCDIEIVSFTLQKKYLRAYKAMKKGSSLWLSVSEWWMSGNFESKSYGEMQFLSRCKTWRILNRILKSIKKKFSGNSNENSVKKHEKIDFVTKHGCKLMLELFARNPSGFYVLKLWFNFN